jgi:hypothetical protein
VLFVGACLGHSDRSDRVVKMVYNRGLDGVCKLCVAGVRVFYGKSGVVDLVLCL